MTYNEDDIQEMVQDIKTKRADWEVNAEAVEKMWALQPFEEAQQTYLQQDGIEAFATADPYNIIQLFQRFVAGEPRIEIPYLTAEKADEKRSGKIEAWLMAYWAQMRRQNSRNPVQDAAWHTGVRGRGAIDVQWVGFDLPGIAREEGRAPIETRILDPLNTGFCYGPFGLDYAYHNYKATRSYIETVYPDYEFAGPSDTKRRSAKQYDVVSMWIAEPDRILHCVTVDKNFAKRPTKTKYRIIPMVEWMGDGAPIDDEAARSLSLLHPINGLWQAKSRIISNMATGMTYYFNPILMLKNPKDEPWKGDIEVRPGGKFEMTGDQDATFLRPDPNVPMATTLLNVIDAQIQQATFPSVMYGEEGGASSGYAINQLASSARGRINTCRMNLESSFERVNQIILMLVEVFGGDEGVTLMVSGREPGERGAPLTLSKKDIQGNYANEVRLVPEIPTDETQRLVTWDTLVEHGRVSNQFYRDRIINVPVPRDEELRISLEQAVKSSPELQQKMWLAAIRQSFKEGDEWRRLIAGTPYEQLNQAEEAWVEQEKQRKEAERLAKAQAKEQEQQQAKEQAAMDEYLRTGQPPEGWHAMPDGSIMRDSDMQETGNGLPPLMPPGPPMDLGASPGESPMAGAPRGFPPPSPGMPPAMPGALPPEQTGMLGGGLPLGLPPGMGPGPSPQGPPLQGPLPGPPGVPPEMGSGGIPGLTPEMMGVPPEGGPPGMYQAMQGAPLTEEEIARRLLGAIQNGPPPPQR